MKKILLTIACAACSVSALAANIPVREFRYAGPFPVKTPFMVDSVNVKSKTFEFASLLDTPLSADALKDSGIYTASDLPLAAATDAIHLIEFSFQNSGYTTATIKVEGVKDYKINVDGKDGGANLKLQPFTHKVRVRYFTPSGEAFAPSISIETPDDSKITFRTDGKHLYSNQDVLLGTRLSGVSLSSDGKYMIVGYTTTMEGGRTSSVSKMMETASGRVLFETQERLTWMPVTPKYYKTRRLAETTQLLVVDPATGVEEVLVEDLPQGNFRMSPTEDFLLYNFSEEGPQERPEIYQILTPDDRQPGWRTRSYSSKYDISTGVMQRLTYGYHNARVMDISPDGKYGLLAVSEDILTQRPSSVVTLYLLNLETLETRVLVDKDGFMGGGQFSPDGKQVLLQGSPEAFDGIGMNVKKGQTPSMEDMQLYILDLASGKITPQTKNFNPNVSSARWSKADGMIYFTAENRDYISFYVLNPKNGRITQIETKEDLVNSFALATDSSVIAYYGQGASNSDRLYTYDAKSKATVLKDDLSVVILKDVDLGECREWNFKNSKGETVYGRFYLPPDFDPSKKYPMIVNYYGGCSPTSRNFESRYPQHAYAALGYVVYVVAGPSGATGFGQEWSARHVNTAGDGPAQDIIEGTIQFCKEHPFVNEKKIGCIGASYGGFMSEYLPTVTDIFACSVSHAGISGHSSYWGVGYWGYSYSEVSMANTYPWSDRELYVDQSPLYRADKINTPILLVHGDVDTNVPFTESIQLFTALKRLGKEVAFVAVKDQNHHILDYQKRLEWQETIWAWFAKWLQDDPSWWNAVYSPKNL
ncbi:MAG: S9 family peptidase [Bacteroidales bacterium]|nr:S9 family peptidase [Bacteroidales bacterium]